MGDSDRPPSPGMSGGRPSSAAMVSALVAAARRVAPEATLRSIRRAGSLSPPSRGWVCEDRRPWAAHRQVHDAEAGRPVMLTPGAERVEVSRCLVGCRRCCSPTSWIRPTACETWETRPGPAKLVRYHGVIRPRWAAHGGREADTAGMGSARFDAPASALRAAAALAAAAADRDPRRAAHRRGGARRGMR